MSVDFPNEAALCQCFLATKAQLVSGPEVTLTFLLRSERTICDPIGRPEVPSIYPNGRSRPSETRASTCAHSGAAFVGPKVVDEQAHIAAHSTADELQRFLPRQETPIDQSNLFRYAESHKFLSQIIHDIPAR